MVRIISTPPLAPQIRRRGRPCKQTATIDLGTKELREKRKNIALHEVQLTGTVASFLLKQNILTLQDIESLQKIYILKRRYMNLLDGGQDLRSQVPSLMHQKSRSHYYKEQRENMMLERTWKELRSYVQQQHKQFLAFLDGLFRLYSYETLNHATSLFRAHFSKEIMDHMSKIAQSALL